MRHRARKNLAAVLAVVLIFGLSGGLSAKGRSGADLLITLKNGSKYRGELIAVRPDSLLLLDHRIGKDETAAVADIATVRVVRRSKAWQGLLIGFVPGAVGGAALGAHASAGDNPQLGAFAGGVVIGGIAGLVGLAAGFAAGLDTEIAFAGLPESERSRILAKLDRRAREPGSYFPRPLGPMSEATKERPAPIPVHGARFRLTWMPGFLAGVEQDFTEEGVVPFRFTEALPPGEAGPYLSTYYWATHTRQVFALGRFGLSYQWGRRLGAEIELHVSKYTIEHLASLRFVSTLDGLEYAGVYGSPEIVRSTALLFGLTYRFVPLTDLQPHAVEIGLAAGPALMKTSIPPLPWLPDHRQTVDRATTWTARARVSYDHHFSRALSMGAYAEYRRLRADIPSFGATEDVGFHDPDYGNGLMRTTEIMLPARSVSLGGFSCGLRFGFGF